MSHTTQIYKLFQFIRLCTCFSYRISSFIPILFGTHRHTHTENLCTYTQDRCFLTKIAYTECICIYYIHSFLHSYKQIHIGRVFRFGQTQKLACIPNKIAYQTKKRREERPEGEREECKEEKKENKKNTPNK